MPHIPDAVNEVPQLCREMAEAILARDEPKALEIKRKIASRINICTEMALEDAGLHKPSRDLHAPAHYFLA